MNYLNQLFGEIIAAFSNLNYKGINELGLDDLFNVLKEEIEKLDVLGFPPDKRFDFLITRAKCRKLPTRSYSHNDIPNYQYLITHLQELFLSYGAIGSQQNARKFDFIVNADLKTIIERDYAEFNNILMPDNAWKSAIVLAGSILEAILYDVLESPAYNSMANNSPKAPTDGNGHLKNLQNGKWSLQNLIEVAVDISVLSSDREKTIDQVLRNYRNFVHPKKEVRVQYPCTEAEAYLAKGALDSVLNHLETIIT